MHVGRSGVSRSGAGWLQADLLQIQTLRKFVYGDWLVVWTFFYFSLKFPLKFAYFPSIWDGWLTNVLRGVEITRRSSRSWWQFRSCQWSAETMVCNGLWPSPCSRLRFVLRYSPSCSRRQQNLGVLQADFNGQHIANSNYPAKWVTPSRKLPIKDPILFILGMGGAAVQSLRI